MTKARNYYTTVVAYFTLVTCKIQYNSKSVTAAGKTRATEAIRKGSAISQCIRLYLPSSDPRFESLAFHLHLFNSLPNFVQYLSLRWEKDETKQKEAGFGPIFKINETSLHSPDIILSQLLLITLTSRTPECLPRLFEPFCCSRLPVSCAETQVAWPLPISLAVSVWSSLADSRSVSKWQKSWWGSKVNCYDRLNIFEKTNVKAPPMKKR